MLTWPMAAEVTRGAEMESTTRVRRRWVETRLDIGMGGGDLRRGRWQREGERGWFARRRQWVWGVSEAGSGRDLGSNPRAVWDDRGSQKEGEGVRLERPVSGPGH